jgi:hypothetical protein
LKPSAILLACCCALIAAPGRAGEPMSSYNNRADVFFTFLRGGEISFLSQDQARSLQQHCASGGFVFPFHAPAKYKCKVRLRPDATGQLGESGKIDIIDTGQDPDSDAYTLFSTTPVRKTQWQVRPLSHGEVSALTALRISPAQLNFAKASAIYKTKGNAITFIVPGKSIHDEFYAAQRHHVFVERRGVYRYQGRIPDKPTHYFDVDGDSIPEIKTDESCDGWCKTLWDVHAAPKVIATFGGH